MSRPKNMVRRWPVRRVNETQAHGDAPQVPISPHPRSRRVVTRHQSQIRAHSLRCLVTLEAENGRWGRGRDTRSAVKRRGTPFSASVMNWKCYYLVEFSELALPAEGASSAGRALSPAPSALKPACELISWLMLRGVSQSLYWGWEISTLKKKGSSFLMKNFPFRPIWYKKTSLLSLFDKKNAGQFFRPVSSLF